MIPRNYRIVTGTYPDTYNIEVEKHGWFGRRYWDNVARDHDAMWTYAIRGAHTRWFPPFDSLDQARMCVDDLRRLDVHVPGEPVE